MVQAVFMQNAQGQIKGFTVKGHAGFDDSGKDIVCAAVSAIVYTALGGLDELADIHSFEENEGDSITCFLPENLTHEQQHTADIILNTMLIGLKQIELEYKQYIKVRHKEV